MRTVHLILVAIVLQALVFAGCTSSRDRMPEPAAAGSVVEVATDLPPHCGKNEFLCTSCDGTRQFCGAGCPQCFPVGLDRTPPSLPVEVASVTSSESSAAAR
jgi:hypothetical protein